MGTPVRTLGLGFLAAATICLVYGLHAKKGDIARLKEQKLQKKNDLETVEALRKTGMQACSMLNELQGWEKIEPLPVCMFDHFSGISGNLALQSFRMEGPALYRPLAPCIHETGFFKHSLAFSGYASAELVETRSGQGKYDIPRFLDEANACFDQSFSLETPEPEEGAPNMPRNHWRLNASLKPIPAWSPGAPGESAIHE